MYDKKNENNRWIFKIPKKLVIFHSDVMYGIIAIIIIISPLILFFILNSAFKISGIFVVILLLIISSYILITGLLLGVIHKILPDYVYRFQNHPIKKWILKNLRCPICEGEFVKIEPVHKQSIFFFEYMYICKSCERKFVTKRLSKYEQKFEEY